MNKVVVHTEEGEIIKGYTGDFARDRECFHLSSDQDGLQTNQTIQLTGLKAIFFVKSFEGNFLHKTLHTFDDDPGYGRKVMIKFRDGERFYGRIEVMRPEERGFFIFPLDPDSNTIRAFVFNGFIDDIHFMDQS